MKLGTTSHNCSQLLTTVHIFATTNATQVVNSLHNFAKLDNAFQYFRQSYTTSQHSTQLDTQPYHNVTKCYTTLKQKTLYKLLQHSTHLDKNFARLRKPLQ